MKNKIFLVIVAAAILSVTFFFYPTNAQLGSFWIFSSGGLKPLQDSWDVDFYGEISPDGATCSNGEILKKTGADDWDCAADNDSGGAGGSGNVATSTADVDTYMTYFTSTGATPATIGGEAGFTYDDATNLMSVPYASTTAVTATTFFGALTGNASTASLLAANGANCSSGNAPLGVDDAGAVESCFDVWTEAENTSAGYLSSVDISDDTNLGVTATGLELSGDDVALTSGYSIPLTASTTEWATAYSWGDWNGNIDISDDTNLTVGATGIELSDDDIALTGGYSIPLTASTTEWATAYSWGDHSSAGYLTDITAESVGDLSDVTVSSLADNEILTSSSGTWINQTWTEIEAQIESVIDTLANLTSIQGLTVTLADAGADAFFGWDDTASAYENLTAAEALTIVGGAANDFDGSGDVTIAAADISDQHAGTDITADLEEEVTEGSLADDVIVEADLKVVDSPEDEECLTYESTGGDFEWQTCGGGSTNYSSFTYATSTAWAATSTIPVGVAYNAQTWTGIRCSTNQGTLNVVCNDGTNDMELFNASTTVGIIGLSTNNSFSSGEVRYCDAGTPASSPSMLTCTVEWADD